MVSRQDIITKLAVTRTKFVREYRPIRKRNRTRESTFRPCSHTEDAPDIPAISRENEPMKNSHEGGQRKISTRTTEPRVGIFWLIDGKPLIDSTPLNQAEPYGDHLTHARGHAEVWGQYQRNGAAPLEMEYEEAPRGRVIYHTKTRRFTFLADRCILKDRNMVGNIMEELHLPGKNTDKGTDDHYRCSACPPARLD